MKSKYIKCKRVSARELSQPKFGHQNEDGASVPAETPDVIMTLVSYFCGLPGVPRKARKPDTISARFPPQSHNLPNQYDATLFLMPPGKKTKKTLYMCFCRCKCAGNVAKGQPFRINI